jgi:uncharacterized paraquat-inducible protein A
MSDPHQQSDFRRIPSIPDADLIAEIQAALNELNLTDLVPAPEPFVWKPFYHDEPEQEWDRDYPGDNPCPSCNHQLELDADFRCTRCGTPS